METTITLEINEIETEVKVSFISRFGTIEILDMTDVETGEAITPDLLDELSSVQYAYMMEQLHDFAADNSIPLENSYNF